MEYSFAFFYYNPHFCEAGTSSVNSSLNEIEIIEDLPEIELQYDKAIGDEIEESSFEENVKKQINETDYSSSDSVI